jgi:excisionase family DNA binding protein
MTLMVGSTGPGKSEPRKWLKVGEVAVHLDLSEPRVYQMIAEGEIPGVYRTGKRSLRIDHLVFIEWLESRKETGRRFYPTR